MKFSLAIQAFFLLLLCPLDAQEGKPELFSSVKPVYKDDFGGGDLDTGHWQVRQGSTWTVKEGILNGGPSPREYQEKKIAAGDRAHAGFKPVIWLEKVPENLVVHFRLRYDGEDYQPKFPLIDVGHHIHTLVFAKDKTTLVLKSNEKSIEVAEPLLPLNEWVDVSIELKKGSLVLVIGGKRVRFDDPLIDMAGQQQIDFKGIDGGGIQIDRVEVGEGVE